MSEGRMSWMRARSGAAWGVTASIALSVVILVFFLATWWVQPKYPPTVEVLGAFIISALALIYLRYQIGALQDRPGAADRAATRDMNYSYLPGICLVVGIVLRIVDYFAIQRVGAPSFLDFGGWLGWLFGFLTPLEWGAVFLFGGAIFIDVTQLTDLSNRLMQRPTGPSINVTDVEGHHN
ncbi:MAG: hypothetical protein U1E56_07100 [Bauldia sp.]